MGSLVLLCIVFVTFTGLTKGAGVLPDGPLNAAVGGSVMFNTALTTEKPFLLVRWIFNGTEPPIIYYSPTETSTAPEYEGRITFSTSTGSLELRRLTVKDTGEYTVSIITSGTEQKGNTELVVHVPVANVVATSNSTDLVEFSSVRLSCSSSGSSLSFLWMNSSSEVTASDRVQLTDGGSTLTILNVTRYDQGPYICHVFSPVSNGTSDPVNFSISYGPENVQITGPSEIEETQTLTLTCSADSKPSANYSWILNKTEIHNSAVFTKDNTKTSDSGSYTCEARNNITGRTSSAVYYLTVKVKSPGGLSAGAIAGIIIMICFIFAVGAARGYFIYKKKVNSNPQPNDKEQEQVYENTTTVNENV